MTDALRTKIDRLGDLASELTEVVESLNESAFPATSTQPTAPDLLAAMRGDLTDLAAHIDLWERETRAGGDDMEADAYLNLAATIRGIRDGKVEGRLKPPGSLGVPPY